MSAVEAFKMVKQGSLKVKGETDAGLVALAEANREGRSLALTDDAKKKLKQAKVDVAEANSRAEAAEANSAEVNAKYAETSRALVAANSKIRELQSALDTMEANDSRAIGRAIRAVCHARQMEELRMACGPVPITHQAHAAELETRLAALEEEFGGEVPLQSLQSLLPDTQLPPPNTTTSNVQPAAHSAQFVVDEPSPPPKKPAQKPQPKPQPETQPAAQPAAQPKAPAAEPPPVKAAPGLAKIGSIFAPVTSETLLAESEIQARMAEPSEDKNRRASSRVSRVTIAEKSVLPDGAGVAT